MGNPSFVIIFESLLEHLSMELGAPLSLGD